MVFTRLLIVFLVFSSSSLVTVVKTQSEPLKLHGLLPGDIVSFDSAKILDAENRNSLFFFDHLNKRNAILQPQTRLTKETYFWAGDDENLTKILDFKETYNNNGTLSRRIVALTENNTIILFRANRDKNGDDQGVEVDSKVGDLQCISYSANQWLFMNEFRLRVYCLESDKIRFADYPKTNAPKGEGLIFGEQLDTANMTNFTLPLPSTFEQVPISTGEYCGYTYFGSFMQNKPQMISTPKNLWLLMARQIGDSLIHKAINLFPALSDYDNILGIEYLVISPNPIDKIADVGEAKILHIVGRDAQIVNNMSVASCIIDVTTLEIRKCTRVLSFYSSKSVFNVYDMVVKRFDQSDLKKTVISYELIYREADTHFVHTATYTMNLETQELIDVASIERKDFWFKAVNSKYSIKQESSISRAYFNDKNELMLRELRREPSSDSSLKLTTACSNCIYRLDTQGKIVEISSSGMFRQLDEGIQRLLVDTKNLGDIKDTTIEARYIDSRNQEISTAKTALELKFLKNNYSLPKQTRMNTLIKGMKSRLRLDSKEISGPLYDMYTTNQEATLFNSSINRIHYYRENSSSPSGYERIDSYYEHMTGTLDLLFSYSTFEVYRCRPFSQNFTAEEVNVLCKKSGALTEVKPIKFNQLLNFQTNYDKLALLYTKNETVEVPEMAEFVEVCFMLVDLATHETVVKCFSESVPKSSFRSDMILAPNFIYMFVESIETIKGYYADWEFKNFIDIPNLRIVPEASGLSANLVQGVISLGKSADVVVSLVGDFTHYKIFLSKGYIIGNEMLSAGRDALDSSVGMCVMDNMTLFSGFYGLVALDPKVNVVYNLYGQSATYKKVLLNLECINNHVSLFYRPSDRKMTVLRDSNAIQSERTDYQLTVNFPVSLDYLNYNYFSWEELYIMSNSLRPYHFATDTDYTFLQTDQPEGDIKFKISAVYDDNNQAEFTVKYETIEVPTNDTLTSDAFKQHWVSEKNSYKLEKNLDHMIGQSHFWKMEPASSNSAAKKMSLLNRFEQITSISKIPPGSNITRCSSFLHGPGIDVCYEDETFTFSKQFSHEAIASAKFADGYIIDILDLKKTLEDPNDLTYLLVARIDKGVKHIIAIFEFDLSKKSEALRSIDESSFPVLNQAAINIRIAWKGLNPVIGVIDPLKTDTLTLAKNECKQFEGLSELKYIDFYDLFASKKDPTSSNSFVVFSKYNSDELHLYMLDINTCKATKLSISSSVNGDFHMRHFTEAECEFKTDSTTDVQCVFAGFKVVYFEMSIDNLTASIKLKENYLPYKNMEPHKILMGDGFFVLAGSRINDDLNMTHDASGIMYYNRISLGGSGYFSGGLTNLDLLNMGTRRNFRIAVTENRTLIVHAIEKPLYFSINTPKIIITGLTADERDDGLEHVFYGNSKRTVKLWDRSPPQPSSTKMSPLVKTLLIMSMITLILILVGAILYLRHKRSGHEEKNNENYLKESEDTLPNKTAAEDKTDNTINTSLLA